MKEAQGGNKIRTESGLYGTKDGAPRELDEFDIDLLRLLPDDGAKKGKYLLDTMSVAAIKRALDPSLSTGFISTRLKTLRDEGFVLSHHVSGKQGTMGWQRTKRGGQAAIEGFGITHVVNGGQG